MTAGDDILSKTLNAPPISCSGVGGVEGEGMTDASTTQHTFPSTSSFSPLSQSTISLPGAAFDGMRAWVDGYFGRPVFSARFRKLADESVSSGENDESIGSQINLPSINQTERVIIGGRDSVDDFNPSNLTVDQTRSRKESEAQQNNHNSDNQVLHRSLTPLAPGVPDRTNLSNSTSWDLTASREPPAASEHGFSVDWDGLPLRIDSVTLKFHERQRQEDHERTEHQSQIDRLEASIACLSQEVVRLRALVDSRRNEGNLQDVFTTTTSVGAELSPSPLVSPEATVTPQSSHVDGQDNPPSYVVEALSDAIDNHQGIDDYPNCGVIYVRNNETPMKPHSLMTRSATDDILLNWPDGSASHNANSCSFNPLPLRRHCCPSTSSDYSSFDVVESSALLAYSGVSGGPVCGGCDNLDGVIPSLPCGFCGNCSETLRDFNNCKSICGTCDSGCLLESSETRQPVADSYSEEEENAYRRGYAAHLSCAPLPSSCTSRTTPTAMPCSPACADGGMCRHLERRFPSGSSLTCSSAHSQNGTAKA
ncbi:unnamed protein product [Hydatigera taeniaeformis]|uniref:TNFR-Cys domain-containing protein n=1 Tax=Hydatigena taeniaeformis TaxID=6205 RepID=A0A0R3XA69_HYDTA|nr:unnamed protein product [Hydatigera taeniaeformis]